MRIAILSNVTVEVLAGMLKKEHSVWIPPGFGAWMETALNPPPEMREFNPEAVFMLMDSSHATSDGDACKAAKTALESTFPLTTVIVPDLEDLADEVGDFHDERMWKLGLMPWSMKGLRAIKNEINRLLRAMKGERKKVLALDFDNTLWDGVIGEDGVEGVCPFVEFQKGLKELRERGVILVALTKNNSSDVEPVWNDGRMVLKRSDFAALRVDWNDKATNLVDVAKTLNLGTDSFVFLDDNPAEREQMRAMRPEVVVPEFPVEEADLTKFLRRIARLYFPELRLTAEDRAKTEQYQAEAARREFATGLSVDDYLKGLKLWADVHRITDNEIPRVAQLSNKTNQFNVQTHRYSEQEIEKMSKSNDWLILTVHAGDRFGDAGLVGFVAVKIVGKEYVVSLANNGDIKSGRDKNVAFINDFVMSCRVMNRRLEYAIEECVEKELSKFRIDLLVARWDRTPKNAPVENLFEQLCFYVAEREANHKIYEMALPRKEALKHHVNIKQGE